MFKQSLTFITVFLLAVLSSCSGSNNNFKKNFLTENDIRETLSETELKLNYLINDKNKEYFISSLLESDYKFNIVFNENGKKLKDRLTESNLSFFCNSFLDDQLYQLENILFYNNNSREKLIVVFSNEYKNRIDALEEKYPEVKFFLISNDLDAFSQKITGIKSSLKRLNGLESLDRNITINHNPRERKDFNKAPKLNSINTRINWNDNKDKIHGMIRGLSPRPGAWTTLKNGDKEIRLKILKASLLSRSNYSELSIGKVLVNNDKIHINSKDGIINCIKIQLENKKEMLVKDLLNGYKFDENSRVY